MTTQNTSKLLLGGLCPSNVGSVIPMADAWFPCLATNHKALLLQ